MKITEYSPVNKAGASRKKGQVSSSSGAGFLGLLSTSEVDQPVSVAAPSDVIPPASMGALLSLQEIPDDELVRRRAMQESKGTIEALETLRLGLLAGSIPEHLLHTLTRVVALQKERVDDPRLRGLIEDIELRAAVELAKLERAARQN